MPHYTASKPVSPRLFRGDTYLFIRRGCTRQRAITDIRQPKNKRCSTTYEKRNPRISPSRVREECRGSPPAENSLRESLRHGVLLYPRAPPCGRLPSCSSVAVLSLYSRTTINRRPFPCFSGSFIRREARGVFSEKRYFIRIASQRALSGFTKAS